jgi:predicted aconitase with swiveling domain
MSSVNSSGGENFQGRTIHPGSAEGEALVSRMGISFFGGVDPETGIVLEKGHDLEGVSVAGKVLVFPSGKGSTVGSYTLYRMKKAGTAPAAVLNAECEPITAVGCILAGIPCIDHLPIDRIASGDRMQVDGVNGCVKLVCHLSK